MLNTLEAVAYTDDILVLGDTAVRFTSRSGELHHLSPDEFVLSCFPF